MTQKKKEITIHWFRRDLRLFDNKALDASKKSSFPVLPLFIFDTTILNKLESKDDARVTFIYESLKKINDELVKSGKSILVRKGAPEEVWKELVKEFTIQEVYFNNDYEPYAIIRDHDIIQLLLKEKINVQTLKDHVIFEKDEIIKSDGSPYTVFTPYLKKWFEKLSEKEYRASQKNIDITNLLQYKSKFPSLEEIGFRKSTISVPTFRIDKRAVKNYAELRDQPFADSTSRAGIHLRFGTISVRNLLRDTIRLSNQYVKELAWRDFFMQILFHFPDSATANFKRKYNHVRWRNNEKEFELWCKGKTGYPLVDAGMRELNSTGFMHNRVRMVTASFLCKHLLIDWRWGEAYFAGKLLDFELASNVGNWQWSAGTGCDAAPYFRIFNPHTQADRFDPENKYIKKWLPEFGSKNYVKEIVEHGYCKKSCIESLPICS